MIAIMIWLAPYTGGTRKIPKLIPLSAFLRSSERIVIPTAPITDPLMDPIPPTMSIVIMLNVSTKRNAFGEND